MSAHVLLNLLNELGKRDKMLGKPRILSLFPNSLASLALYLFFPTRLINSIKHEHSCKILYVFSNFDTSCFNYSYYCQNISLIDIYREY